MKSKTLTAMNSPTLQTIGNVARTVSSSEHFPPHLYCDGVAGISFGAVICKLDLFQIVSSDIQGENRQVINKLVMPTSALIELCRGVLRSVETNSPLLKSALDQHSQLVFGSTVSKKEINAPVIGTNVDPAKR